MVRKFGIIFAEKYMKMKKNGLGVGASDAVVFWSDAIVCVKTD